MINPLEKGQVWIDKVTKRKIEIWGQDHSGERWITIYRDPSNPMRSSTRHLSEEFIRHRYELATV